MDSNIVTRITTLLVAILLGPFAAYYFEERNKPLWLHVIAGALLLIAILVTLGQKYLDQLGKKWILRFHSIYSEFLFNHIRVRLEYLKSDGSLLAVKRDDFISRLSLKKTKRMLRIPFYVDGSIRSDHTYAINSTFSFLGSDLIVFHCYFDDKNIFKQEHVSSYFFEVADGFQNNPACWIFAVQNYCKHYSLKVCIPNERPLKNARLFHRFTTRNTTGAQEESFFKKGKGYTDWELDGNSTLMIANRRDHYEIIVLLTGLRTTDQYKLAWTLS